MGRVYMWRRKGQKIWEMGDLVLISSGTHFLRQCELPGGQCRPNFQKMFSVPATGT